MISFFAGMWAIFTVFGMERKYNMLSLNQYRKKSLLLKITIILVNVQDVIIDAIATRHVIKCVTPEISAETMGSVTKSSLVMIETLILGSVLFYFYMSDTQHIREDPKRFEDNPHEMENGDTQNNTIGFEAKGTMENCDVTKL